MDMEFHTQLPVDQAVRHLQNAIKGRAPAPLAQQIKPHLEGDVTPERVCLYRKRGISSWYGQFQGRFTTDGGETRLIGRFVRVPGVFMTMWAGFLIAWSILLTVAVVSRWRWPDSAAWLVAALLAASVGSGTFWFRAKNARIEAELLRDEIAERLKGPGA
jgi:hypothetical protein